MKILVTGAAGYIGSHIAKKLLEQNHEVFVLDDFSSGYLEVLEILKNKYLSLNYFNITLRDKNKLEDFFNQNKIDIVVHLAAKIDVAESIKNPDEYYQTNYIGSVNLVEAMAQAGVNKIVFSSTAAVYGNPQYTPIDENHPTAPLNPYGQTKLDFEKYLKTCKNLQYIIFRYFNVGGSSVDGLIGKSHLKGQDLVENIIKVALDQEDIFEIYGDDYKTPDGSAIRDFVHVEDIADAHIMALKNIQNFSGEIFNLGSENGFSVKEIVSKTQEVVGRKLSIKIVKSRPGDISVSVASAKKAKDLLYWNPQRSNLESIIFSDWNWRKTHPLGYTR